MMTFLAFDNSSKLVIKRYPSTRLEFSSLLEEASLLDERISEPPLLLEELFVQDTETIPKRDKTSNAPVFLNFIIVYFPYINQESPGKIEYPN